MASKGPPRWRAPISADKIRMAPAPPTEAVLLETITTATPDNLPSISIGPVVEKPEAERGPVVEKPEAERGPAVEKPTTERIPKTKAPGTEPSVRPRRPETTATGEPVGDLPV